MLCQRRGSGSEAGLTLSGFQCGRGAIALVESLIYRYQAEEQTFSLHVNSSRKYRAPLYQRLFAVLTRCLLCNIVDRYPSATRFPG
jgi:hypothetical protein